MNELLLDLMRHDVWATRQLLNTIRLLPGEPLEATIPGTYGGLLSTIHHAVQSEGFYCYLLANGRPGFTWDISAKASLDELDKRTQDLSTRSSS